MISQFCVVYYRVNTYTPLVETEGQTVVGVGFKGEEAGEGSDDAL